MRITLPPFPVLLQILSSELQQPECISLSLIETVDSPTRTNIRCLYAHMGTITTSASPSISLTESHSVGLRTSFYISATSITQCKVPVSWKCSRTSSSLIMQYNVRSSSPVYSENKQNIIH